MAQDNTKKSTGLTVTVRGGILSNRQRTVMESLAVGNTVKGIAREMQCSTGKVISDIRHIYTEIGVHNKAAALVVLVATGDLDAQRLSGGIRRYTKEDY